jgi:hypothetical protein
MVVGLQRHARAALPLGKNAGPHSQSGWFCSRENLLILPKFEPRTVLIADVSLALAVIPFNLGLFKIERE